MPKKIRDIDPEYHEQISQVSTVPGIAELFHVAQTTVRYWILRGYIAAYQDGGVWLVSVQSVRDYLAEIYNTQTEN